MHVHFFIFEKINFNCLKFFFIFDYQYKLRLYQFVCINWFDFFFKNLTKNHSKAPPPPPSRQGHVLFLLPKHISGACFLKMLPLRIPYRLNLIFSPFGRYVWYNLEYKKTNYFGCFWVKQYPKNKISFDLPWNCTK